MLRILRWLFTGDWHMHQWEDETSDGLLHPVDKYKVGIRYIEKCKICNKRRHTDVR